MAVERALSLGHHWPLLFALSIAISWEKPEQAVQASPSGPPMLWPPQAKPTYSPFH